MPFTTALLGRDPARPMLHWEPSDRHPWHSILGDQAWVRLDNGSILVVRPPINATERSSTFGNGIRIDPISQDLLMQHESRMVDLALDELQAVWGVKTAEELNDRPLQFYFLHQPTAGTQATIACDFGGGHRGMYNLDGRIIDVGFGAHPMSVAT